MNDLTFTQQASLLNEIASQAMGSQQIRATDLTEFCAQAQTVLKCGYDVVSNSIQQVMSATIFATRKYDRKLKGMKANSIRFGNHVRKINVADKPLEDDSTQTLVDGQSVDMYTVNKPKVIQTNFYGLNTYQKSITIYKDQLDVAFSSPEEFGAFIAMVFENISNQIEKTHEEEARATLCNMIGAKMLGDSANVFYLFDEYSKDTGISLTPETYKDPRYYPDFAKWAFGFINTISDKLTEYSYKYHMNLRKAVTGGDDIIYNIPRHTPKAKQKFYVIASEINQVTSRIFSSVFSPEFLKIVDFEKLSFWQNIDDEKTVICKPNYIDSYGEVQKAESSVSVPMVFGCLFDEDACGFTTVKEWSGATPFNVKGAFTNHYYHFQNRPWVDMSENFILFLLDYAPMDVSSSTLAVTQGASNTVTVTGAHGTVTVAVTGNDGVSASLSNGTLTVTASADAQTGASHKATVTLTDERGTVKTVVVTVSAS